MTLTLLFVMWAAVLFVAWTQSSRAALVAFAVALLLSLALFRHHVTDPLTLSF